MKTFRAPVFALILLAIIVIAAGCSGTSDTLNPNEGQVRFVMSGDSGFSPATADAGLLDGATEPGATLAHEDDDDEDGDDDGDHGNGSGDDHNKLQAANVTFSSILARNLDGELIDVTIELPVTIDVLQMRDGRTVELPMGILPPGIYDQLVVVMRTVELVLLNGTRIAVTPPGGGWTAIIRVCPFEVIEGDLTAVPLRLRMGSSFQLGGGDWKFQPEFECETF